MGMYLRRPPMWRMSCSPEQPWMTEPAPRKSSALKKAWVMRWNMPTADAADAEAHHHVAELRDGGVGEDALDVVLRDGDEWRRRAR